MRAVRQGLVTQENLTDTAQNIRGLPSGQHVHAQTKDPLQVCFLTAKVKTFVFPQNPCYTSKPHGGQINRALGED